MEQKFQVEEEDTTLKLGINSIIQSPYWQAYHVQVYGFGCDGNVIWLISHALEYVHVRAVGDYEPQALDELNLKTGDIVRVYRVTNGQ